MGAPLLFAIEKPGQYAVRLDLGGDVSCSGHICPLQLMEVVLVVGVGAWSDADEVVAVTGLHVHQG